MRYLKVLLVLVAAVVTTFTVIAICGWFACESRAETSERSEVEVESAQEGWALDDYDFEARMEAIRREEAAKLAARRVAEDAEVIAVAEAAAKLQPYYRERREEVLKLARSIVRSAKGYGIDPRLALALAFRESSLLPSVGTGKRTGSRGEVGYFQVMPASYPQRVCGRGLDQTVSHENASTAMCYIAHLRDEVCETTDPWVIVGAYGMSRCPSRDEARDSSTVRRARTILCEVTEDCESIWPR